MRQEREYHAVLAMREHVGYGYMKIAQRTGVPESTVGGWIRGDPKYGSPLTRRQRWEDYGAQPLPATRRCTKCEEIKEKRGFYIQFRPSGTAYLSSWCKACLRAKSEATRRANPEAHRERSRKAHRARRRQGEPRVFVNAEPFLRYIEPLYDMLTGDQKHRVRETKKSGRVTYAVADAVLTHLGEPGAMRLLYGEVN